MIPTSIIMKIKAQQQGDIKGDLTQTGREGYIKVISVNHEITSAIDPIRDCRQEENSIGHY